MKVFWLVLVLMISAYCQAEEVTKSSDPVAVFKASGAFEDVVENVKLAIEARGMLVSGILHISDMLNRTGPDLGFRPEFEQAESVEFCSALISHKMTQVSPENMAICPFTISVYVRVAEPDLVYVAYRRQHLAGEAAAVTDEINALFNGIVEESIE